MGSYFQGSVVVPGAKDQDHHLQAPQHQKELDAGALFVLKSKGSWVHCGYHLTTSTVAPALLSLPYTFTFLGWIGGIICLVAGALITFYNYNLLSLVLEHHAHLGRRQLRFREMARHILGPKWGTYVVGPIQFAVCYGGVVAACLLGGQCMKAMYLISNPNGTMKLYEFIVIFGAFMLILAQIPSFHSLRHINLISLMLCLAYSACATAGSIYIEHTPEAPKKDYSIERNKINSIFGIFTSLAIIATTYGNGIIPEIQATLAPPVKGKMFKGLCLCYIIVCTTFFSVAVSGYWAFGNQSQGQILGNFVVDGRVLLPKWFVIMTNTFVMFQIIAVGLIYLQPTNEVLENFLSDPKSKQFSLRNVVPRMIARSLFVGLATTIAAMLPFFGDIMGLVGAFGFLPLDFILPVVFFNLTFKPSKFTVIFWLNFVIALVSSILVVIGSVAAVRQIILDAKTYQLFANV